MLEDIVQEWSEYARNMGSKIYLQENSVVCVNEETEIACDFSNCVITTQRNYERQIKYDQFFNGREYALYQLSETEQHKDFAADNWKNATIMLLNLNRLETHEGKKKTRKCGELSSSEFLTITEEKMGNFRDVVFNAFSYDSRFRQQSEKIYKAGLKSGGVRFYGLSVNDDVKSVALVHFDPKKRLGGMELVSTKIDSQKKGYASFLLNHIFDYESSFGLRQIWLFSISGSIAERFYLDLGFKIVSKLNIRRSTLR